MEMKKFFGLPVKLHGDTIECDEFAYATTSCEYIVDEVDSGEAIVEAINKHDQHVERIAELEKVIDRAIKESNFYINVSEDKVTAIHGLRTIAELLEKTK